MEVIYLDTYFDNMVNDKPLFVFDQYECLSCGDISSYVKNYNKDLPLIFKRNLEGNIITYSKFKESNYNESIYSKDFNKQISILNTNLPIEFYSKIEIPNDIITFDSNINSYLFKDQNRGYALSSFDYIWFKGIRKPLTLGIKHGKIILASSGSYFLLLVAIYLKLPSIPVSIFVVDEEIEAKFKEPDSGWIYLESDLKEIGLSNTEEYHKMINKICNPYITFFDYRYDKECKYINENKFYDLYNQNKYECIDNKEEILEKHNKIIEEENKKLTEELISIFDYNINDL